MGPILLHPFDLQRRSCLPRRFAIVGLRSAKTPVMLVLLSSWTGLTFSRLDRLHPIGSRAKWGPAICLQRSQTYTFNRSCLYSAGPGLTVFFKHGPIANKKVKYAVLDDLNNSFFKSKQWSLLSGNVRPNFFNSSYVFKLFSV